MTNTQLPEIPGHHWEVVPFTLRAIWGENLESTTASVLQLIETGSVKVSTWQVPNPDKHWWNKAPTHITKTEKKPVVVLHSPVLSDKDFKVYKQGELTINGAARYVYESVTTPETILATALRIQTDYKKHQEQTRNAEPYRKEREAKEAKLAAEKLAAPSLRGTYPPKTLPKESHV